MTPREFSKIIVQPNVAAFHNEFGDLRHAYNAIGAIDALAAHLFWYAKDNASPGVASIKGDTEYRQDLAGRHQSFSLLRDIAKAQKHVRLVQGTPRVDRSEQVASRSIGYGEGGFGAGRYGGPEQVIVDLIPDKDDPDRRDFQYVEAIVDDCVKLLEQEMVVFGVK